MQLAFDAADRLVELLEERRGPVRAEEAASVLFALERAPAALALSLLQEVVGGDVRLAWRGSFVALAGEATEELPLKAARFVVVDLETTGLRPGESRICEIGAVRIEALSAAATFETLVDPGVPLPPIVSSLTGIEDEDLVSAPGAADAVRSFLAFAGDAVLVAHNARFDVAFLDREVERLTGRRLAAPVLDTVGLARRLLAGRVPRVSLSSLSYFFGTSAQPCHRALPDAEATAEILIALIGLAQERGARTVADVARLAAPRARRVYDKRSLVFGAPTRPGVYIFRGAGGQALYVGRARNLRARLRSYFRSDRQRPAVEAALAAVERIEWQALGSELEAALEELGLIRELRPPANSRAARPDRYVYLKERGDGLVVTSTPTRLGPIRSRRRGERAARALQGASPAELALLTSGGPLPRLRSKLRDLSECLRYEDAARLRDRIAALEAVTAGLRELERLRKAELCLLVPAIDEGCRRAFFLAGGRIAAVRTVRSGPGGVLELESGIAEARSGDASLAPEDADELLLAGSFLRRPPPELTVLGFEELISGYEAGDARTAMGA
jgi:DNA polymerase III epsilon subunit family exonuclease